MKSVIAFVDSEITLDTKKIKDLGAIKDDGSKFHSPNRNSFSSFISDASFICGHNIIHHDLKYIGDLLNKTNPPSLIDTLYLSPLLFPKKPYHKLLKDDKLQDDELNNPLSDSIKARDLFYDEVNAFGRLPNRLKKIFCALLYQFQEFKGFFEYIKFKPYPLSVDDIKEEFEGKICTNANIAILIKYYPIELAYALALIACDDKDSITPPWVLINYPNVENVIRVLRHKPCPNGCKYCNDKLDIHKQLKRVFGFDEFRTFNNESLQEKAVDAAVKGKSLLVIFPTGGGKSITFQLPAIIAGEATHGLTVVISPLLSLMKDQVDNLEDKGRSDAVSINGLLSPVERQEALDRVFNGMASLLYISPEQLRSKTIEKLLLSRNVVRFVIDEAHCFSAWGQDFRVDYLYIGEFIKRLQEQKRFKHPIPVSCFTATAKQKVISDIVDYFKKTLGLDLEIFATNATRENLRYIVWHVESVQEKYDKLRSLIEAKNCPTIVYVSRTRTAEKLAAKLSSDGYPARFYHGKMDANDKIKTQEDFISNKVKIIVATSAFGMGVDKKDIKLVVHYDISDSLENYIQEAGRAGRDQSLNADCYVLYNDGDLDKHFALLNQSKLSISEIQQVWKAIKDLTRTRKTVTYSPLEVARQAGWDDSKKDIEDRVKIAIAALENAGYVKRGHNVPRIFANSILVKNMQEAASAIDESELFSEEQKATAKRIVKYLISRRSIATAGNDDAESRVDYISDRLGLNKEIVIELINLMRQIHLLDDFLDMSAYIYKSESSNKSMQILDKFTKLELFLLEQIENEKKTFYLKELNDMALKNGLSFSTIKDIRTIFYFWVIKGYIKKDIYSGPNLVTITPNLSIDKLKDKYNKRMDLCSFIIDELYRKVDKSKPKKKSDKEEILVEFSLVGLYQAYQDSPLLSLFDEPITSKDVADALLYLSKINALKLEGGFLVLYSGMELTRLKLDNKIRYKNDDYQQLSEFYQQKIQQIHIVGEYANLMVENYQMALQFVNDYFQMDYKKFISKYFKGERAYEIERNITPERYQKLFGELSKTQTKIISDDHSKYIVVAAGPGSGKTRVLVHKLAAILLMEDVKNEQLLMVTFSRSAATEFKKRLIALIGEAAYFVEIKTFHSYCFDLLGKIGSLDEADNVVKDAAKMIEDGEVELGRITKTVLVIDEAQDMDENEFALVKALMARNDDMRVIAVGDDDQNIFEFRGSDSAYLKSFITDYNARKYEMTENYRSKSRIVAFANYFVKSMSTRMKSLPIKAVQKDPGIVQLIHHNCEHMEQAVVDHVINNNSKGSVCVLTNTNDEAMQVVGLLNKKGYKTKLIQSNDGFSLYNLVEIRSFLCDIEKDTSSPIIDDKVWEKAKERLKAKYKTSPCLENCLALLSEFESINKAKYRTDLEEFIAESNYADFIKSDKDTIFVSTIHKVKGREFDCVYMLLNNVSVTSEEKKRMIYVGITRAKNELYIHFNNNLFKDSPIEIIEDNQVYDEPDEITLQLTHQDVNLGLFKFKQKLICSLRSGDELQIDDNYLSITQNESIIKVAQFSKAFQDKLLALSKKGYKAITAKVTFQVWWKGKEDKDEIIIILPEISFRKEKEV